MVYFDDRSKKNRTFNPLDPNSMGGNGSNGKNKNYDLPDLSQATIGDRQINHFDPDRMSQIEDQIVGGHIRTSSELAGMNNSPIEQGRPAPLESPYMADDSKTPGEPTDLSKATI
ncbi:MAG: hypothetical protein K6C40_08240, partial [Thermoguttaceae bacterium]|nr:hypothetical protein [Thermoguttaceae bacterium]